MSPLTQSGTLPLFEDGENAAQPPATPQSTFWSLSLSAMDWLTFLSEEWWQTESSIAPVLGISVPLQGELGSEARDIIAWIDPALLAPTKVKVFRAGVWLSISTSELVSDDKELAWPGPIPLFAVKYFGVSSAAQARHLTALAQGFANIQLPQQPIVVEALTSEAVRHSTPCSMSFSPPQHWNSFRGAAAMAVWSVPSVTPWLEMLGQLLSKPNRPSRPKKLPATHTPWLADSPWKIMSGSQLAATDERSTLLWRAMVSVLTPLDIQQIWRPHEVLEHVCDQARRYGLEPNSIDELLHETSALLDDRKTIDAARASVDPVGFVLQLVLLRPKPEQFVTWRADLPSLPPAILWTGAILSGLVNGYRNLEVRFRGSVVSRKVVDLQTWTLSAAKSLKWPGGPAQQLSWRHDGQTVQLLSDELVWFTRQLGRRGSWYNADFGNPKLMALALEVAKTALPDAIRHCVSLTESRFRTHGAGALRHDRAKDLLTVKGNVLIPMSDSVQIVTTLDVDHFKDWLATGTLAQRLPALSSPTMEHATPNLSYPPGLCLVNDLINEDQERQLINIVNSAPWSQELKRRVQHYGWKYDYRKRGIHPEAYLGPLPDWAQRLARKLYEDGYMPELADQVIVNEYIADQGISKHIDCQTCFRGPVVTISLNESWQMWFRLGQEKVELVLPRRSAAIIDGPARHEWTHEIPQRRNEGSQPRSRRISLTFRKVNVK